jgi:branched-chain amino acid transport system permease protein
VLTEFLNVGWSGATVGATYALAGLGILIALRVTRVVNLAQGEFYVVGALLAATLATAGVPLILGILAGALAGAGLGAGEELIVLRRMRNATPPIMLLSTVAVATLLAGAELLVWGQDPRSTPVLIGGRVVLGGVRLPAQSLLLVGLSIGVAVACWMVLERTSSGRAMSAIAEDPDAARLTGIDVLRLRLRGLAAAGAIGGAAGAIAVPLFLVDFNSGLELALRGFIAAAISGSTALGTLAAGLGIGILEALAVRYISPVFDDVTTFGILVIAVLMAPKTRFLRAVQAA